MNGYMLKATVIHWRQRYHHKSAKTLFINARTSLQQKEDANKRNIRTAICIKNVGKNFHPQKKVDYFAPSPSILLLKENGSTSFRTKIFSRVAQELIYDVIITGRLCDQHNMLGNTSTNDIKYVYQLKFFVRELGAYVDDTVIRQEILVRTVQYALREDKD